jgi:hypothetical protein
MTDCVMIPVGAGREDHAQSAGADATATDAEGGSNTIVYDMAATEALVTDDFIHAGSLR